MADLYESIFSRNIGILTRAEQETLRNSTVAIAGAGGVGGLLAERVVRLGIGRLKITDPGDFEASNLNRQFGSTTRNFEENKAAVVCRHLAEINPTADITWDEGGITTEESAKLFAEGAGVVVDEMDYGLFRESIYLQRAARAQGAYYLFAAAIGFGASVVIFDPNGMTLEEYNKVPIGTDLSNVENVQVPMDRIVPTMPSYVANFSDEDIQKYLSGELPATTTSIGVGMAVMLAANETMNILLKKRPIPVAPQYVYIDLMDQQFTIGSVT